MYINNSHIHAAATLDHSAKTVKRSNLQLWQFLLQLLNGKEFQAIIEWTKKDAAEFKLLDPEEVLLVKMISLN